MRSGEAWGGEESWLEPDFVFIPLGPSPGQELKSYREASSREAGAGSLLPEALPPWPLASTPQAGNKPPPLPLPPPAGFALQSTMEKRPWTLPFSFLLPLLLATHAAQTGRCRRVAGHFLWERVLRKMGDKWNLVPVVAQKKKKIPFAVSEPSCLCPHLKTCYVLQPKKHHRPASMSQLLHMSSLKFLCFYFLARLWQT